jgi:hypothetical membrane protein
MLVAVRSSRPHLIAAAVLWIVAALVFVVFEWLAAAAVVPSYSYAHGYISDLGVPAWSPRAALMNTAFWVQGLGFLAGAVLLVRACGGGLLFVPLAMATAAGNILVAVAHGGSALVESGYAWLHVLGAILAIVGGNTAILAGSPIAAKAVRLTGYRVLSFVIAILGLACLAMLSISTTTGLPPGLVERASVYSILAWQALTGLVLLARPRRAD